MRRQALTSKLLFCLAISLVAVFSLLVLDVSNGQDAFALGGGGGGGGKNSKAVSTFSAPSANDDVSSAAAQATDIPEASTLLLIGLGVAGVAVTAFRDKFKKR